MPYLIGTDEAGYGPRLGPLLISISAWHVNRSPAEVDLYEEFSDQIRPAGTREKNFLVIDDSKKLYQSRGSLRSLERAVLSCLGCLATPAPWPTTWKGLWRTLTGNLPDAMDTLPWYTGYDEQLPIDAAADEIEELKKQLQCLWQDKACKLVHFSTVALFPAELNSAILALDSKGEALTRATTQLIATTLDALPDDDALIVCDKHGGRNRYLPALQRQFPETLVHVLEEGRPQSRYRFDSNKKSTEICFRQGGESFLPTALASLGSKYLRELAMRAWTRYWIKQIPDLKPTAGYPVDAARFRQSVEPRCEKAGLPLHLWWRMR